MNPIPEIKRFILRALARTGGLPLPDSSLNDAVRQAIVPQPLLSDVEQSKREMEADGFIGGSREDLDGTLTWTLTAKGTHKAKQLG
ncbi:MAG TPA: hypothetical protein VG167_00970 [Verrucomicrobiae bacterium]|nr:hypothetical protein [Verrucomicrobiae bacterium]